MISTEQPTALENWLAMRKLPPAAGFLACVAAASVDEVIQCCRLARENRLINGQRFLPDLAVWREMYRTPGLGMPAAVGDLLAPVGHPKDSDYLSACVTANDSPNSLGSRYLRRILRLLPKRFLYREAQRFNAAFQRQGDEFWSLYRMPPDTAPDFPPDFEHSLSRPEILFFCRVTFPCWYEFGTTPNKLYVSAADGDMDALINLISLDALALELQPIRHHYACALYGGDDAIAKRVKEAHIKPPNRAVKPLRVKYLLGAHIYKSLVHLDNCLQAFEKEIRRRGNKHYRAPRARLGYPDLQSLFDAVAKDKLGHEIDTDLPDDPRSFERGVRRELPFWQLLSV